MPLTPTTHSFYMAFMSETNSTRVITPMPKSLVQAIDDYRYANRHPSRAEAIRRLIELGLEVAEKSGGSKARRKAADR
jgi:metal-responsive CopG/Arc/MetJ family transcriptional regulator